MIPLHDANPARRFPLVTILLLLLNVGVYFLVQGPAAEEPEVVDVRGARVQVDGGLAFNLEQAAIPCEVVRGRPLGVDEVEDTFSRGDDTACADDAGVPLFPAKNVLLAVLTSMFLHGGLVHLGGNMLFLWIFGNNIEDRLGHLRYLVFYLLAGIAATLAHIAVQPSSTVPVVGASGAIAGVMGAYLVWFPKHRVTTLFIFFIIMFRQVQARWVLGIWFFSQFLVNPNDGVAWVAHVGGFIFGVVVGLVVRGSSAARRVALTSGYRRPEAEPFDPTSLGRGGGRW